MNGQGSVGEWGSVSEWGSTTCHRQYLYYNSSKTSNCGKKGTKNKPLIEVEEEKKQKRRRSSGTGQGTQMDGHEQDGVRWYTVEWIPTYGKL